MHPCFPCFQLAHPSPVVTLQPAIDSAPLSARVRRRLPPEPPPLPGDNAASVPLRRSPAPLLYRRYRATPSPPPPLHPGHSITAAHLTTATLAVPPPPLGHSHSRRQPLVVTVAETEFLCCRSPSSIAAAPPLTAPPPALLFPSSAVAA
ncbi:uncharacterized protein LOC135636363 [Musa acuminata AAA Group]|uniref:uncharacterized protein LOC135636363 n=1 Tax=Musa acuminata AAA Group TaxID=214697 RepID=UPI0031D2BAA5